MKKESPAFMYSSFSRLMRVIIPFMIAVIVQRLVTLVSPAQSELFSLVSFIASAAAGIAAFVYIRNPRSAFAEGRFPDTKENTAGADTETATEPFPSPETPFAQLLVLLAGFAGLTALMYGVGTLTDAPPVEVLRKSPLRVLSLVIVHPIGEEYIFRKLFYRELRPMDPIFACFAQAVMFAIMHRSVGEMIYALASGIILVIIYENSGSLYITAGAHAMVNLRSYLYITRFADDVLVRSTVDFAVFSLGIAAALILMIRRNLRYYARESAKISDESKEKTE